MTSSNSTVNNGGYYITNIGTSATVPTPYISTTDTQLTSTICTDKYSVDLNEVYEHVQLLKHFMKENQSPIPVPNWEAMEKHEVLRKQWEDVMEACNVYRITETLLTGRYK